MFQAVNDGSIGKIGSNESKNGRHLNIINYLFSCEESDLSQLALSSVVEVEVLNLTNLEQYGRKYTHQLLTYVVTQ